jgi:hypothetical protein
MLAATAFEENSSLVQVAKIQKRMNNIMTKHKNQEQFF